ncbi:MAG: trypsin-like peptidase domain-containing protein [Gorillibacterium sp.]|nr:trypsin-like peptidase domain-containing protein [Gorillibacterium sp.]
MTVGLFQDDFYRTRPSRISDRLGQTSKAGRKSSLMLLTLVVVFSLAMGSFLTVLLFRFMEHEETPSALTAVPYTSSSERAVAAVSAVQPTVVSVITMMKENSSIAGVGMGSGVIFRKEGDLALIATNNHVVEAGNSYEIVLSDGERRKAVVVGKDKYTDLAVLSIDASGIKSYAEFGNSDKIKPGETAIAIGNPLGLSFSHTVTAGIISSSLQVIPVYLGKDGNVQWEMEVIQTDAPINQGNSGGALINLDGKVIGINSMKIADAGVEGLGFAIPSNTAVPVLDALARDHKIKRPMMGIHSEDVQAFSSGIEVLKLPKGVDTGVIVTEVGDPAKASGLKTSDVIVKLDNSTVNSTMELRKYLFKNKKIGDELSVTYYRDGDRSTLTLTLGEAE